MSDDENQGGKGDKEMLGTTNIYKVSVKYSPFNRDDPEIWFTQLEAQFGLANITVDGTKYGHLIAALDQETIKCVREMILRPPDRDRYTSLKTAIVDRICDSAKSKLNKLLSGLQLGDKKPSHLLREMQALSVNQINDNVLQNLWLQRLPTQIEQILSCMENVSVEKLAETADKILEVQKPLDICPISNTSSAQVNQQSDVHELKLSIDSLTNRFNNFLLESRSRSQNRDNDTSNGQRSRSRSSKNAQQFPLCWYHFKFSSKARKCNKPCSFMPDKPNQPKN